MKTILFIDKEEKDLWSSFLDYDFLLNEFQDNGSFDLCPWNREATSVTTAIPKLAEILGSEDDWQAVIVSDLRLPEEELRQDIHFDNPFDFADRYNATPSDSFSESLHPLVRLTHMLGGLPEKVFIDWHKDERDEVEDLNNFEVIYASGENRYDILERYRLGLPRPKQIICVTPRDVDEAFFETRNHDLLLQTEEGVLDFWQRNDYPAITRFVVLDRIAPMVEMQDQNTVGEDDEASDQTMQVNTDEPIQNRRSPWFDFWMCMLVIMTSTIEPSDFHAYTVYHMGVMIDETVLSNMLARRRCEWNAARKEVDLYCQGDAKRLESSEYEKAEIPSVDTFINVPLDQVSGERLYSDPDEVRFYKDKPEDDTSVWFNQKTRIMDEFRELLRTPRRVLRNAAASFRACKPITAEELEYCVLNESQKDKLIDDLREREYELACGVGAESFAFEDHSETFDKKDADLKKAIESRPSRAYSISALVFALIALIIGFLPYCLGLYGETGASINAVIITIICLLPLIGVWIATMLSMRDKVRSTYLAFNDDMQNTVSSLTTEVRQLEKKLSSYATFRKEWAVFDRQNHLDMPTQKANKLGYFSALLKTRISDIDKITQGFAVSSVESIHEPQYDWGTLLRLLEDESFYNIRSSQLNQNTSSEAGSKSFADVPYEFISAVSLDPIKVH